MLREKVKQRKKRIKVLIAKFRLSEYGNQTEAMEGRMEQIVKVVTGSIDGDAFGKEWKECYVLYESEDDEGFKCFDLYNGDGEGDEVMICRGYNINKMRSLTLQLGTFVEWKKAA